MKHHFTNAHSLIVTKNREIVKLSQNLFLRLPSIKEMYILHSDVKVLEERILWPDEFNKLSIYNSAQMSLPELTNSNITDLRIERWPNLKNISGISEFKT